MAPALPLRILVQVGHEAPREPGFQGGTGAAGEVERNRVLADALMRRLDADKRFLARRIAGAVPADVKNGSWHVHAFVALHCDGHSNPAIDGYSFGFPPRFGINKRLADLIAGEFAGFHRARRRNDNYTRDLSGYYAWKRVPTTGPEVLVEHGFVSNPTERAWIDANVERLADAEYRALLRFFALPVEKEEEPAGEITTAWSWFPEWALWVLGRGKYAEHGARNPAVRPRAAPARIPQLAWVVLRQLQRAEREHDPSG